MPYNIVSIVKKENFNRVTMVVSFFLSFFQTTISFSQVSPLWVKSMGGNLNDRSNCIAFDSNGNVFSTGYFEDTVDFDPGLGVYNLIALGTHSDIYIQKLDPAGNLLWAKRMGSSGGTDAGRSIAVDSMGSVYTTGHFQSFVDFDPGLGNYGLSGGVSSLFIQKLDSSGNFVWAKSVGTSLACYGNDIKLDHYGNIYLTGSFEGTTDFDPGVGVLNLSSNGSRDVFVQKLDSQGSLIWVKSIGGLGDNDAGLSIDIDIHNNVYVSGIFEGTVDFDPSIGVYELSYNGGSSDMFIEKLDSLGNFVWAKSAGSSSNDGGNSIKIDQAGYLYTTGYFGYSADFDPTAGIFMLSNSTGCSDFFIQKLDTAGNFIWAKSFGSSICNDNGLSIDIDDTGNLYVTGTYSQTVDFDSGVSMNTLTSVGGSVDVYVQKLNPSGDLLWAKSFGGTGNDVGRELVVDNVGVIYLTGYFQGISDFEPGNATINQISSGGSDIFLLKLTQCTLSNTYTSTPTLCNGNSGGAIDLLMNDGIAPFSFFWNNDSISEDLDDLPAGTYTCIISDSNSCGQVLEVQITQPLQSAENISLISCDAISLNGEMFTSSGIYTQNLIGANGCDSLLTINLSITQITYDTVDIFSCLGYLWNSNNQTYTSSGYYDDTLQNILGCDSIITLNLTINNSTFSSETITSCNDYLWPINNQTYTASGTYVDTIPNVNGCDSIITLNLTIHSTTFGTETITYCNEFIWPVNGQTYTTTGTYLDTIPNANGCDSIITLDLTIIPSLPLSVNTFSLPSDANSCIGAVSISTVGEPDFTETIDGGSPITNSGYTLVENLCPGVHSLFTTNGCGDTLTSTFVIPVDSNYIFNNPFIDSIAIDSLGATIEDCEIYYNGIDTAFIDSIFANGNTVTVIWNIVDSNGSNFDTSTYVLNNGNGVYYLQFSVFCPTKSLGEYFVVTEAIYFEDGIISTAGLTVLDDDLFELFPNPTNDLVTIRFEFPRADLVVYDTQGKRIATQTIISGDSISLAHLETGVYFFELATEQGKTVKRVVKQ